MAVSIVSVRAVSGGREVLFSDGQSWAFTSLAQAQSERDKAIEQWDTLSRMLLLAWFIRQQELGTSPNPALGKTITFTPGSPTTPLVVS